MDLPALLPEDLKYSALARNQEKLVEMLVRLPPDLITFFEYACDDEGWSLKHPDFMKRAIAWITEQYFDDKLLKEYAQRAAVAIQNHIHVLDPYLDQNLTVEADGLQVQVSSLMWEAASDTLREMIRQQCRDRRSKTLLLEDVSAFVFEQIEEFIETGTVKNLWRKEQHEVIEVLRRADDWGLVNLMFTCEDILKRYISPSSVVEILLQAHEERWCELKRACIDFINANNNDVRFEFHQPEHLEMTFLSFRDAAMGTYETLHEALTHLGFEGDLLEDSTFSDVINRAPKLVGVELSHTTAYSENLLDLPGNLTELDLSMCPWLNATHLTQLFETCPDLIKVSLAYNQQLGYSEWGCLNKLRQLQRLDITHCLQLNDEDLKIILQASRNVTHLTLSDCPQVTDALFMEIGRNLPHLTDLDISRCNITDPALIDLTMRTRGLMHLNIIRCTNITEKGVVEAARNAYALQTLKTSQKGVLEEIKEARPFLRVIESNS